MSGIKPGLICENFFDEITSEILSSFIVPFIKRGLLLKILEIELFNVRPFKKPLLISAEVIMPKNFLYLFTTIAKSQLFLSKIFNALKTF